MPARLPQKTSFIRSSLAFLLIGLVALLSIVGTTMWLVERSQTYFNDVISARDVRSAAVELRNTLLSAETAQRGFIITGNEIYLAPYDSAKNSAFRYLDTLKLQDEHGIRVAVKRLASIVAEKFQELDSTIALKRARRDSEAIAEVRSNRGKALMDEANVFFVGIINAADERLTTSADQEKRNAALLRLVTTIAGVVIIIVVGGATLTVLRYTRELARSRDMVERRVQERTSELAQANEEIKRFAHIVSHDLRAPLVNIMGFTSELEISADNIRGAMEALGPSDPMNDQARIAATQELPEAIGFIRSSTNKMNDLITAILKISRDGHRKLIPEQVSIDDVAKRSASSIQHQLSKADGTIKLDISVPEIRTDRLAIEQIFGNLLENAVKYRAKDRPLAINVRARTTRDNRIDIEIADNGRGIAEKDHDRIFDLFKRSGEQDQPGEGLGLAYVRTLIRNLGGEISLTSALGKGTTFRILLPRDLASSSA